MTTAPARLTLVSPHAGLDTSYRSFVQEFVARGEPLVPFTLGLPHHHFDALLASLAAFARGERLPDGFVPHSTWWLVRDDAEIVGISNLRHDLTDSLRREGGHIGYGVRPSARRQGHATELLRRTLARAADLGIRTALVTCARDNVASARTILRNGGRLVSEEYLAEHGAVIQRYEVPTSSGDVHR
jgi:predicted acetyltransferase